MNKWLIDLITEKFNAEIQKKNSWGKNEIMNVYTKAVADATLIVLDKESRG